jgi:hypothetical protein
MTELLDGDFLHSIIGARVLISAFSLASLVFIWWYVSYWNLFPKYSIKRVIPWLALVCLTASAPFIQMIVYREFALNGTGPIQDQFVFGLIAAQGFLGVALIFWGLKKYKHPSNYK